MIWTATLTILEDYFRSFPGAVITVSHDRYFLDKVADKLLVFQGNGNKNFITETCPVIYWSKRDPAACWKAKPKYRARNLLKEEIILHGTKEWETIEDEIAELEEKSHCSKKRWIIKEIISLDYKNCKTTYLKQKHNLKKMARWEYLSEWVED